MSVTTKITMTLTMATLVMASLIQPASARSIRVDEGDWDVSDTVSIDSTEAFGFDFNFFGVAASSALISTNGSILLANGEIASIFPFLDVAQQGFLDEARGGPVNIAQYRFATTNEFFIAPGIEAGFRATWQVFDSSFVLLNQYQVALFELTDGSFAVEFNFDQILFGSDNSEIGFSTSLGDEFDLPGSLGLSFADYMGVGDDDFSNNCPGTPNVLACNNYFFNTAVFGQGTAVLPDIAGGFFRQIDSNGGTVQGRYLFIIEATDTDEDGVPDDADNCTEFANPAQRDTDGDGIGNWCDADLAPSPNDCLVNFLDLGTLKQAFFSVPASANWNPDADFNGDDAVNFLDLGLMKDAFFQQPGPSGLPNACGP